MPVSPSEDELTTSILELKKGNPELGISKIHTLLLTKNPEWTVSEKRTRKIIQAQGLTITAPGSTPGPSVFPSSRVASGLDVEKWTTKVGVKWFDKRKGKGLVAKQEIAEGDVIWKEDPFIIAPEWDIFDMQWSGSACAFCSTPLDGTSTSLNVTCSASNSNSPVQCPTRFCNRLCLTRSANTHPLVCPSQNPACVPLLRFARKTHWMSLQALIFCTSRLLLSYQKDEDAFKQDWEVVRSFAELGMEERHKYSFGYNLSNQAEPDRDTWQLAYKLFLEAFKEPKTASEKNKLSRILKKPLPEDIDTAIFDYDGGFLRGLGRMSLNLEGHGGLYSLHSHLNHSCIPSVSVRHLDQRTALARITLVAKRKIDVGEELTVSYVNPNYPYHVRQEELQGWGFGTCTCARCVEEAKTSKDKGPEDQKLTDLASELKAGLGVM